MVWVGHGAGEWAGCHAQGPALRGVLLSEQLFMAGPSFAPSLMGVAQQHQGPMVGVTGSAGRGATE